MMAEKFSTGKFKASADALQIACDEAKRVKDDKEKISILALNDKQRIKEQLDKITHERDDALVRCNHLENDIGDKEKLCSAQQSELRAMKEAIESLKNEIDAMKSSASGQARDLQEVHNFAGRRRILVFPSRPDIHFRITGLKREIQDDR